MAKFVCNDVEFEDQMDFIKKGRRCATPEPSADDISRIDINMRAFRASNRAFRAIEEDIIIHVRFCHIVDGDNGRITAQQREDQIKVLNTAYKPHRIQFEYDEDEVHVEDNAEWFGMGHRTAAERAAKTALKVDPAKNLNFYTANPGAGLLGWATFPWDFEWNQELDGVVMLHSTLPGGTAAPYNLGQTATHEIGHLLGLYHTFQGGCDGIGDHVGDTVAHSQENYGKPDPTLRNYACDPTMKAPVKNFMNYVDDDWMDHFTDEQGARMRDMIGLYRPGFLVHAPNARFEAARVAVALI